MTVSDVWYRIEDMELANDDAVTDLPNGNSAWSKASQALLPTPDRGHELEQAWTFTYNNIPTNGPALLRIILLEESSSTNLNLSDSAGHFTTLLRSVKTAAPSPPLAD